MIVTLYVSVISFLVLLFQYINVLFPDPLNFYLRGSLDSIRWSTATLLIMYPVFFLCSWLLQREVAAHPEKAQYRIRKWLLHLTLFIAALVIITDLITLIYNFLSGELTVRFLLKILVVLLVTGTVFGYYLWDVRRVAFGTSGIQRGFAWGVTAVLIVSILGGFFLVGSPMTQRKIRFDERRVNDLQMLQYEITHYRQQKRELPPAIDDLRNAFTGFTPPVDPATAAPYEYRIVSPLSFELCAVFALESSEEMQNIGRYESMPYPAEPYGQQHWTHGEGRVCFERTIDPQLFPPVTEPPVKRF